MKLLTIILILTMICTPANGAFQHSIDMSSGSRIGYTTNYGNSFGQTTQQTYYDAYTQNITQTYSPKYTQAPRKAKGDNSDVTHGTATSDDGTVTITWSIEGYDIFGWFGYYYIYVDDVLVDQGTMWRSNAEKEAQEKAKELANERSHSVPIGDLDFYLITALLFSYFIYNYMKKRRQQFLLYTGI